MLTRIAVLVSGGGTNLQALLDARGAGKLLHGQIILVVSDVPGTYALQRAERAGVPALTLPRRQLGNEEFERQLSGSELLSELGILLVALAGYLRILSPQFAARWPRRILNIHPSLIPSFCGRGMYGLKVHQAALDYGVKVTGATVHYVNEIPDGGEILLQKAVEVLPGDTPETLQRRVMEQAEWLLLPRAAELVARRINEEKEGIPHD